MRGGRNRHSPSARQKDSEKALMLTAVQSTTRCWKTALRRPRPTRSASTSIELANAFNSFYHETKILSEEDEARKDSYIGLITLTRRVLEDLHRTAGL